MKGIETGAETEGKTSREPQSQDLEETMEHAEETEPQVKGGRGRQGKTITISLNLGMPDYGNLVNSQLRMARRTGEDVTRERVISNALQCLLKSFSSHEQNG